ncbi:putative HNH endonuclease [Vibrio jasicida]|uniref:HNH endonuclease n=1 Tax=Vibrio jasicida TaxID=766224 RepID=A0AAU9QVV3_9VIBR|nr:putative HNH endonuclease [Vibrio jasicida]CAH1601687.1 putative HNH endonuclease [Vibrio jasicida]
MDLATKFRNELLYDPESGQFLWRQPGRGRRPNLVAGSVKKKNGNYWRKIVIDGQEYTCAQVAWTIMTGQFPQYIIDHEDGDSLNDAWDNLRRGDNCVAQRNLAKSKRNKTGVTGVKSSHGSYVAYIGVGKMQKYLGCSTDFFEAVCMRKRAEKEYEYSPRHGS